MLTLPIKKKKGNFFIAIYGHCEHKSFLTRVDGYLFDYKNHDLGLYKTPYTIEKYVVVDIKTGYKIVAFSKLKDLQIELNKKWDEFVELEKTDKYENIICKVNKMELATTEESLSLYCWEVKQWKD